MMDATECRARAATATKKAGDTTDPTLKAEFLEHCRLWIVVALAAEAQDLLQLTIGDRRSTRGPSGA